jgi:hypothetical protein
MRRRARQESAALDLLLEGGVAEDTPLSRVLAAAMAPGTPHDLAGLDAARSAFLATGPAAQHRPPALPAATRIAAGRLLTLKAIAAVGGATLIGGVAYAASDAGLLGGSSPQRHGEHSSSAPGSGSNADPQTSANPAVPGGTSGHPHPSRATTPNKGHGGGATAHASHTPHGTPPATHPRGTPSSRPSTLARPSTTPAPSGHAKTTPPQRPTDPAPTHPTHPAPTRTP